MLQDDKWIEITVITSHEAVEAVSGIFYMEGVAGVAIEDPKDVIESNTNPKEWDYIEERLLPEDTGEVKVKGYFPCSDLTNEIIESIKAAVSRLEEYGLDKGKGEVITKEVREQDWANSWKEYYKPFKIGENIVIKPSWESYDEESDDIVLELDPGMAFGTGTHETTRMCIELLEKYMSSGSGILSIAASKLGASKVVGVDIDEVAVKASKENIDISKVENVDIRQGNLLDVVAGRADVIVANIIADIIIKICNIIPGFLKPGGVFISSGIIKERYEDVKKALVENNFNIIETREMGEWAAVAAVVKE